MKLNYREIKNTYLNDMLDIITNFKWNSYQYSRDDLLMIEDYSFKYNVLSLNSLYHMIEFNLDQNCPLTKLSINLSEYLDNFLIMEIFNNY